MPLSLVIGAVVVGLAFLAIVVLSACVVAARADAKLPDLNE
jgi:multisubunit Na+/H+ antiporter MnhC subunit